MNLIEVISLMQLREKREITKTEIAKKLGISYSYLQRIKDEDLPLHYIEGLEVKLGYRLQSDSASSELHTKNDGQESPYWAKSSEYEYTQTRKLRTLWGDKEIYKGWWNTEPSNIRALRIFDDRMDNPNAPEQLEIGDIVSIDVSKTDYTNGGVFLYTAELDGFRFLRIARITIKPMEGLVTFSWNNSDKYPPKSYTFEQLRQAKFKVRARVMNNETHVIK